MLRRDEEAPNEPSAGPLSLRFGEWCRATPRADIWMPAQHAAFVGNEIDNS